jgi:hypothetical protein
VCGHVYVDRGPLVCREKIIFLVIVVELTPLVIVAGVLEVPALAHTHTHTHPLSVSGGVTFERCKRARCEELCSHGAGPVREEPVLDPQ